jgi:hypothetical protein
MIPFGIGMLGYNKHITRTEFYTESATFTAFLDDMDDAVGNPNTIPIERLPPIFHDASFIQMGFGKACASQAMVLFSKMAILYHNWV